MGERETSAIDDKKGGSVVWVKERTTLMLCGGQAGRESCALKARIIFFSSFAQSLTCKKGMGRVLKSGEGHTFVNAVCVRFWSGQAT